MSALTNRAGFQLREITGYLGKVCKNCGGERGERVPYDRDGYGCLENIYHSEDPT